MARVSVKVPAHSVPSAAAPVAPVQSVAPAATVVPRSNQKLLVGAMVGFGVLLLIIVIALLSDRSHLQNQVNKLSSSTTATGNTDAQKYQAEIGKIVELPSGQKPSLVPVKDASKLASENPFFKNAKNGDVVLLYILPDKSVTAVLYRPSDHKVIELTSSATIGGSTAQATGN